MIEIGDLHKHFGDLVVLDELNLQISKGEVVALVGPSGCGKTTLLRCIAGLDQRHTGTIRLNGEPIREYLKQNRIAVVLQKYSNFDWLSVYENVSAAFISNRKATSAEQERIITSLLRDLGIADFRNSYMNELSGGMQQRVAVARALAQDTSIIALDEPFGALDIRNRNTLQILFSALNETFQRTVLLITHDIDEAIVLANRIVILCKIPARVVREFVCDFKGQRDRRIKYSAEFLNLKKEIEDAIFAL